MQEDREEDQCRY